MLEIRSLRKIFGALVAVDDVSFVVEPGQLVGLLGPNGAGKTTIVSMIAGLIKPDRGQVLVGVEGNEWILPYIIQQCGAEAFAYASDYPHEVDLVAAKEMIHDTVERPDLIHAHKAAVLGGNAKRFFRL